MLLLAKDEVGYRNLLALTTAAHLEGYYYKPRIDKELLAKHAQGLIGTSACLGGEVLKRLAQGDEQGAAEAAGTAIEPSSATGTSTSRSRSTGSTTRRGCIHSSSSWRDAEHPARRDERHALHAPGAVRGARPPRLHPDRIEPRHTGADALREQRVLPEAGGRDAPPSSTASCPMPWTTPCHRRAVRRVARLQGLRLPHFEVPEGETEAPGRARVRARIT